MLGKQACREFNVPSVLSRYAVIKVLKEIASEHPELATDIQSKLTKEEQKFNQRKHQLEIIDFPRVRKLLVEYDKRFYHLSSDDEYFELLEKLGTDINAILHAVTVLCLKDDTSIGEYEYSLNILHELAIMLEDKDDWSDMQPNTQFKVDAKSFSSAEEAIWFLFAKILDRAVDEDCFTPKKLEVIVDEAVEIDTRDLLLLNSTSAKLQSVLQKPVEKYFKKLPSEPKFVFLRKQGLSQNKQNSIVQNLLQVKEKRLAGLCLKHMGRDEEQLKLILEYAVEWTFYRGEVVISDAKTAIEKIMAKPAAWTEKKKNFLMALDILELIWMKHTKSARADITQEFVKQFPGFALPGPSTVEICSFATVFDSCFSLYQKLDQFNKQYEQKPGVTWSDAATKLDNLIKQIETAVCHPMLQRIYRPLQNRWKERQHELSGLCTSLAEFAEKPRSPKRKTTEDRTSSAKKIKGATTVK